MNMKLRNIPFSPPDMSDAEIEMVAEALRSGWITTGPKTKEFEQLIAMCCGTEKAVCLNSATACMESILRALGVGPGDEVITSAYTYTATASITCHVGAKVVMVDTKPGSFEMDYDKMADAITERTKVAINGFGRIGRLAFRQMFGAEGYEVVAINDLTNPTMLAHLLKYDSAQGRYEGHTVEAGEDYIVVDGKKITIYAKANAAELPWGEIGVDVVLECTGFYTSKAKQQAHIDAAAKKAVISAPAGNDLPTVVFNVNHDILTKEDTIISAASCTTNCLAPMAKALIDYAPIQSGIMSTM